MASPSPPQTHSSNESDSNIELDVDQTLESSGSVDVLREDVSGGGEGGGGSGSDLSDSSKHSRKRKRDDAEAEAREIPHPQQQHPHQHVSKRARKRVVPLPKRGVKETVDTVAQASLPIEDESALEAQRQQRLALALQDWYRVVASEREIGCDRVSLAWYLPSSQECLVIRAKDWRGGFGFSSAGGFEKLHVIEAVYGSCAI